MRMSTLFGKRYRERVHGAESASHDLLLRAGYVRQHAAGIYTFLVPGLKALRRIERIVREEMDAVGAQEILMSVVQSADPWKATGRYAAIDATLVRFRDRRDREMVLGMTHEEIVAQLAATEITSYRQAGVVVYQIQTKFRDELRPRGGLLRTREFLMKDAYSLHLDAAGLEHAYRDQATAYGRIFQRCGLKDIRYVRSSTGDMGGKLAHEFVVLHEAGEDTIALCGRCGDGYNTETTADSDAGSPDRAGDRDADCQCCGNPLDRRRAIEVGNIFQLGTLYSEALGVRVADRDNRRVPLVMGSYGIGISRLLATLVEQRHDHAGIALPAAIAPFDVHVIAASPTGSVATAVRELYLNLRETSLDVLFDDRDLRAGEKFADADLIGATLVIIGGARGLRDGRLDVRERRSGRRHEISLADATASTVRLVRDVRRRDAVELDTPLSGR